MRPVHLVVEPRTPPSTASDGCSDVPYAIQVASPSGPYADRDANGLRVGAWGAGLFGCCRHLVPNCCMATLCPCVSLAQIAARLGVWRFKSVLCSLASVSILQLLFAVLALAQVLSGGGGSGDDDDDNNEATSRTGTGGGSARTSGGFVPRGLLASLAALLSRDCGDAASGGSVVATSSPAATAAAAAVSTAASTSSTSTASIATAAASSGGGASFLHDIGAMAASPWGVLCLLLALVHVCVAWRLRAAIRARFAIPGACALDLLVSLLLPCCSVAQMATHTKSYKPRECRFGPPDVLPAYPVLSVY